MIFKLASGQKSKMYYPRSVHAKFQKMLKICSLMVLSRSTKGVGHIFLPGTLLEPFSNDGIFFAFIFSFRNIFLPYIFLNIYQNTQNFSRIPILFHFTSHRFFIIKINPCNSASFSDPLNFPPRIIRP